MDCPNCEALLHEIKVLRAKLKEANERAGEATELLVKGEALREKMFLEALLGKK